MRSLRWSRLWGSGWARQRRHGKQPPVLIGRRGREMDMRVAREVAVELGERLREPVAQGVKKRRHLDGLLERAVVGRALRLVDPVCRQILTGIAEGIGAFDPDLFTLQGALQPLQDTEFIVLPVDPRRPLVLFDDRLAPTGRARPRPPGRPRGSTGPLVPRDCLMTARASMTG